MQIVGGNNASWYGNSDMNSSNGINGFKDEYDWADLENDLYHWTKTLRPVQVLLRSGVFASVFDLILKSVENYNSFEIDILVSIFF